MQNSIELLVWMLNDVRKETLNRVSTLDKEQLYTPPVKGEYPIGAYLLHLCEVDIFWHSVISGTEPSEDLKSRCYYDKWFDPSGASSPPLTAPDIPFYSDILRETRDMFTEYVLTLKDEDLEEEVIMKSRKGDVKITKKWVVYHILEHEAHHRGQMFMLMRLAGWNSREIDEDRKSAWWIPE